ncbi:alpha/beta hydrolase [Psychromicrobium xiongbiense]|uniref:alpha/beta hydrolase n=1 Tax=Psychromicrobium xiongbiense TaxID=3051184 RepID=UPI0025535C04|nr:phospholipase [Psychromicrobium sp. YIM S02556]
MLTAIWSRPEAERTGTDLLVMLHGYGADETAMSRHFSAMPPMMTCVALRGSFEMDDSYGWFLLDYFLNNDFAQVVAAATSVLSWLDAAQARYGFATTSLLGHSQGMAMASTLLRLRQDRFAAVVGLNGFVLANPLLAATEPLASRTPFFWGRDRADLVIHPDAVSFTREWLEANTALQREEYPGMGHGMGAAELMDASAFLSMRLPFRSSM